jgi:hypothetical protein
MRLVKVILSGRWNSNKLSKVENRLVERRFKLFNPLSILLIQKIMRNIEWREIPIVMSYFFQIRNFKLLSGVHPNSSSKPALKSRLWTHHGVRIRVHLFKSNLTFCVVCVFTVQTDEWCVHNRLQRQLSGEI